jgi:serine/threonine-protein kinase
VDADPDLARKAAARLEGIKEEQARAGDKSVAVVSDAPKAQPKPQPQPSQGQEPVAGGLREKAAEPPSPGMSGGRVAGIVIGGVGLVGVGVGLGFGANAKSLNEDALKYCTGKNCWDQKGVDLTNQAKTSATIATVGVVAGAVALVGGVVLAIVSGNSSPEATASSWMIVPTASPNGAGLLVQGDL